MATNSITLLDGTTAYASDVEDKVNPLYTDIDNSNIAASAGIVFSKLDAATVMGLATVQTVTGAKTFTAATTFSANVSIGSNSDVLPLAFFDDTNNLVYFGNNVTATVDSLTFEHQHTIAGGSTLGRVVICTATGSTGPREASWHNSVSPAISDTIYTYKMYGNNDAAAIIEYARVSAIIDDETSGTEDGIYAIAVMKSGTITNSLVTYSDQVQVRSESLVVGTNTNVTPYGTGEILGLYVKNTSSDRRVAMFESTDATASGIIIDFYKNSASPAASDVLTQLRFVGEDSAANETVYSDIISRIVSAVNGSEDGKLDLRVIAGGTTSTTAISIAGLGSAGMAQVAVTANSSTWTSTNTSGDALTITADSLTTGAAFKVTSNSSNTSARNLVEIINEHASATGAACLNIRQDADANCLYLDMNGDDTALDINHDGASGSGISVITAQNSATDQNGIYIYGTNVGAGDYMCIDMRDMATADFLLGVPADTTSVSTSTTNSSGRIRIQTSTGLTRFIPYFT